MNWMKGSVRFLLVTIGIIVLTALGVDATQYLSGSQSALGVLTKTALEDECPLGTKELDLGTGVYCVDQYEAGVGSGCPIQNPRSTLDTKTNVEVADCSPESREGVQPWTAVTYLQAKELCAKAGKRLLSNREWYEAALSTSDSEEVCNINGQLAQTGDFKNCMSARGVHDMIGNVWEWVDAEVRDQIYNERNLPSEGYVLTVDTTGVAVTTTSTAQLLLNEDYFWSEETGVFAMMRGGFYGSANDAGMYSVHAAVSPMFAGPAIGFRCIQPKG
jgi:hypothetical protein